MSDDALLVLCDGEVKYYHTTVKV